MFSVLGTDFGSNCQNCAILIPKWNGHNPSPGLLTRSPPPHNSPSMQGLHHEQMHSGQSQGLEQQPKRDCDSDRGHRHSWLKPRAVLSPAPTTTARSMDRETFH